MSYGCDVRTGQRTALQALQAGEVSNENSFSCFVFLTRFFWGVNIPATVDLVTDHRREDLASSNGSLYCQVLSKFRNNLSGGARIRQDSYSNCFPFFMALKRVARILAVFTAIAAWASQSQAL